MSDFKWSGEDADCVVLNHQPRTAVYATKGGGVCIRQECDCFTDDEDDQVLLTPFGALQIAWKLIETAHEVGIPKPDRKLMAKPIDLGPSEPPGPLLQAMQEAAE